MFDFKVDVIREHSKQLKQIDYAWMLQKSLMELQ